jgi:hypothetical protein
MSLDASVIDEVIDVHLDVPDTKILGGNTSSKLLLKFIRGRMATKRLRKKFLKDPHRYATIVNHNIWKEWGHNNYLEVGRLGAEYIMGCMTSPGFSSGALTALQTAITEAPGHYMMDEAGNVIPARSLIAWAMWMGNPDKRRVGDDLIDSVRVSTVFLGLDHSFCGGPPLLWETMVFGGEHDGYQERYHTREEAIEGHKLAVEMVKGEIV